MSSSTIEIHDVEQGTEEWFGLRAGRPTASEFSSLVKNDGKASSSLAGYAATLAAEHYAGKPLERWEGNKWTERGKELEPIARANYEFMNEVEAVQIGFVTNFDAGCSPDSFIGDVGLLEIKCPSPKVHVETLAFYEKNKKCPPGYVAQVQGQMLLCERDWCDLSFFHPELPGIIIHIERDEAFMRSLLVQIKAACDARDVFLGVLERALINS